MRLRDSVASIFQQVAQVLTNRIIVIDNEDVRFDGAQAVNPSMWRSAVDIAASYDCML